MAKTGRRVERGIYESADGRGHVIGFRDSSGRQRWQTVPGGIQAARSARHKILGAKASGERVRPNPRLKFGEASERWLAEQVAGLRPSTRASSGSYVKHHLAPRWGNRPLSTITVTDAAKLVRELRAQGLAEWTIAGILGCAGRIFKFALRHCEWHGENPIALLQNGERAKVSATPERRIYTPDELAQVLAAAREPLGTLLRLASVTGARESELLALWWGDLDLRDAATATIRFTHQVDHKGVRVALKTEESKATLPLPRAAVALLREHRARSATPTAAGSFVFATKTGRALGPRNVMRALYLAQQRARRPDGEPTFPELFERDERGHLVVDEHGRYVPARVSRRKLNLPDFHALRHGAAMDCDDAEQARALLRHRNSNVTRTIYRAHFGDREREALRAAMERRTGGASVGATDSRAAQQDRDTGRAEVADLQARRDSAQQA